MSKLQIKNLHVSVEGKEILKGVNLEMATGEFHIPRSAMVRAANRHGRCRRYLRDTGSRQRYGRRRPSAYGGSVAYSRL